MRIAILTNAYPPSSSGGAAQIACVYTDLLQARGHEVRVWHARLAYARLVSMSPIRRLAFHLADLKEDTKIARDILAWNPDVLLTHNLTGCGFGTPRAVRRSGVRWVHVLHDVQLIEPSGQILANEQLAVGATRCGRPLMSNVQRPRSFWRRSWSSLRHAAMGEPDAVVSPTAWLLKFHQSYGWFQSIQTAVIPNPIHWRLHQIMGDHIGSPLRVRHSILYVGRMDRDKGILVLLDAWQKSAMHDASLVCIGDGALLNELRQQQIPGVEFRGHQSPEDVRRAMETSAMCVVPSLILENQPTVILEALAAGCHVIASDVGGIAETLDGAGILVPPGDDDALAKAMREIIGYKLQATSYQLQATDVLSRHDPVRCVQRLESLLMSNRYTRTDVPGPASSLPKNHS